MIQTNPAQASAQALHKNIAAETALESKGTLVKKEKFQEYKSARSSTRLITNGGIKITFVKFRLLTQSPAVIDYLNAEIEAGMPGITKGDLLTLDEVNPMATLRREVKEEVLAEIRQEAIDKVEGNKRDIGEAALQKLNAAGSDQVANTQL